jgi:hypothetical protein
MIPDSCDIESRRCSGPVIRGWRSNHLGSGSALAWCTAQVFGALSGYHRLLRNLLTTNILNEFGGQRGIEQANTRDWLNLMDADLELVGEKTTLKKELQPRLLDPQLAKQEAQQAFLYPPKTDTGSSSSSLTSVKPYDSRLQQPLYSAILFGPPGTAKVHTRT